MVLSENGILVSTKKKKKKELSSHDKTWRKLGVQVKKVNMKMLHSCRIQTISHTRKGKTIEIIKISEVAKSREG